MPKTRSLAARLFGYDVFVSFALSGADRGSRAYASDLARRLRELDFTVFFSEEEAPAGAQLDATLMAALRRSRTLVLIANRGTLRDPRWVRTEVEEFRRRHPERPVVPISIDGALQDSTVAEEDKAWLGHAGRIWIDETARAVDEGACSDDVVRRLATAPSAARSSTKLRGLVGGTLMALATLAAVAFWQADQAKREARAARAALSSQLATHAQLAMSASPPRSLLLSVAALNVTSVHGEPRVPAAEEALRAALAGAGGEVRAWLDEPASAVELSTDGGWLAVATTSGHGARLWDLRSPRAPPVDISPASTVAFSPDGRWLMAVAPEGNPSKLWALGAQPAAVRSLAQVTAPLAFSADGQWLVSAGTDRSMRLWPLGDGAGAARVLYTFPNERIAMAQSRDHRWLAAGSWSDRGELGAPAGAAVLCDLQEPQPCASTRPLPAGRASLNQFEFTPDGRWLAAASSEQVARPWRVDPDVRLFELTNPDAPVLLLKGHTGSVTALAASDDGTRLASGANDGSIRVWDLGAGNPAANPVALPDQDQDVAALAFASDQKRLFTLTGGRRNNVDRGTAAAATWDLERFTEEAREPVARTAGEPDQRQRPSVLMDQGRIVNVSAHRFDTDRRRVLLASGATLLLVDLTAYEPIRDVRVMHGHEISVANFALARDILASGGGAGDHSVRTWDLAFVSSMASPQTLPNGGDLGSMSPDGRWLLTRRGLPGQGMDDLAATLWDMSAHIAVGHRLGGHAGAIHAAKISPDSRWAATGAHDGKVRLWRLAGNVPAAPIELRGHGSAVHDLAFSRDGRWLATCSSDKSVRLWDLSASDPNSGSRTLSTGSSVHQVEFVGERWVLAAGLAPLAPRLWDMRAVDIAASARDLPSAVGPVQASADGRWLLGKLANASGNKPALWRVQDEVSQPQAIDAQGQTLTLSPTGKWLLSHGADRPARMWSLEGSVPVSLDWPAPARVLVGAAFAAGDKVLIAADPDGNLHRFEPAAGGMGSGKLLLAAAPNLDEASLDNLAISEAGDTLYLGGKVPRLLILQGNDAMTSIRLPNSASEVGRGRFSRDGRWLFTAGPDYSLQVWHGRLDDAVRMACAIAGRDIDAVERQMFGIDPARRGVCSKGY